MRSSDWTYAVDIVRPYMVEISTDDNRAGSGFIYDVKRQTSGKDRVLVATAGHNVKYAVDTGTKITIKLNNGHSFQIDPAGSVQIDLDDDVATIILESTPNFIPSMPPALIKNDDSLDIGEEIAWMGYPGTTILLSFSHGYIKCVNPTKYDIDGFVTKGESGGPAFVKFRNDDGVFVVYVGVVTNLIPIFETLLPDSVISTKAGIGVIRKILPHHHVIKNSSEN